MAEALQTGFEADDCGTNLSDLFDYGLTAAPSCLAGPFKRLEVGRLGGSRIPRKTCVLAAWRHT